MAGGTDGRMERRTDGRTERGVDKKSTDGWGPHQISSTEIGNWEVITKSVVSSEDGGKKADNNGKGKGGKKGEFG